MRLTLSGRYDNPGGPAAPLAAAYLVTIIQVMTTISLADAKARLSAVLDEVRDTHDRVVVTRNGTTRIESASLLPAN